MMSLQNQLSSLDTTDLPSWVIAKLGFAVLSWEIQCLSSALHLSEPNWDLPAPGRVPLSLGHRVFWV